MYSNINIYAFFTILLCLAPLISADASKLSPDYYNASCPNVLEKVFSGVRDAIEAEPKLRIPLIQMHFHDCLVDGCEASILLDDTKKVKGEKGSAQNKNISARAYKVIDDIKKDIEATCPQIVSCADIVTLVASASIKLGFQKPPGNGTRGDHHGHGKNATQEHGNGKHGDHDNRNGTKKEKRSVVPPLLGRLDGVVANRTHADKDLPSSKYTIAQLIKMFGDKGLSAKDMFLLAGAYKIGTTPNNGNFTVTNILTPLDWNSNPETAKLVKQYDGNFKAFFKDFWVSMVKISTTQVITPGDARQGEVRRTCGIRNSK